MSDETDATAKRGEDADAKTAARRYAEYLLSRAIEVHGRDSEQACEAAITLCRKADVDPFVRYPIVKAFQISQPPIGKPDVFDFEYEWQRLIKGWKP